MDDVKRKVLLDLFAAPSTLLPIAGGLTLLVGAWAFGGGGLFHFAGLAGILGGLGLFATRLVFGVERITNQAYEYVVKQQQAKQQEALEQLDRRLVKDRDPRTQTCLRQLRQLVSGLKRDIREGRIAASSRTVLNGIDQVFHVCVEYLERSYDLWNMAKGLEGRAKQRMLSQREEIVREVQQTVQHLGETVVRLQTMEGRHRPTELARLRDELDESLQAARRAEERVAQWTSEEKGYDASEFES